MNHFKKKALALHLVGMKGKIATRVQKNIDSNKDLLLAYSPGVSYPCIEISRNKAMVYEYTTKGNFVAVITNGSAVLGLGNLGSLASKPVMEGKAALLKKFANIDAIDVEVDEKDPQKFIDVVKSIGGTWGGVNLEDIKAPECFDIERKLDQLLDIPVFHDDQHGTAIVICAALINALFLTKRIRAESRVVVNGAGAASFSCIYFLRKIGIKEHNIVVCDSIGVIFDGRNINMNRYKKVMSVKTHLRTLEDALKYADIFIGLSVKNILTQDMVLSMSKNPIIFAIANPEPEILPHRVVEMCDNVIIATGRSDFKNQINNVICFPYLFRGALDTRTITINDEIKVAAIYALADLVYQDNIKQNIMSDRRKKLHFTTYQIIPSVFDKRLLQVVSTAVAKAAIMSGVAYVKDFSFYSYSKILKTM